MINLLIVDDDSLDRELMIKFIKTECNIDEAENAEGAISQLTKKASVYDCFIIDYRLPDFNGSYLLKEIKKFSDKPVIVVTGQGDEMLAVQMIKDGAFDYLPKDHINSLDQVVQSSIKVYNAKRVLESLNQKEMEFLKQIQKKANVRIQELDNNL